MHDHKVWNSCSFSNSSRLETLKAKSS